VANVGINSDGRPPRASGASGLAFEVGGTVAVARTLETREQVWLQNRVPSDRDSRQQRETFLAVQHPLTSANLELFVSRA
jgi:hypothetical protein